MKAGSCSRTRRAVVVGATASPPALPVELGAGTADVDDGTASLASSALAPPGVGKSGQRRGMSGGSDCARTAGQSPNPRAARERTRASTHQVQKKADEPARSAEGGEHIDLHLLKAPQVSGGQACRRAGVQACGRTACAHAVHLRVDVILRLRERIRRELSLPDRLQWPDERPAQHAGNGTSSICLRISEERLISDGLPVLMNVLKMLSAVDVTVTACSARVEDRELAHRARHLAWHGGCGGPAPPSRRAGSRRSASGTPRERAAAPRLRACVRRPHAP